MTGDKDSRTSSGSELDLKDWRLRVSETKQAATARAARIREPRSPLRGIWLENGPGSGRWRASTVRMASLSSI